MNARSAFEWWSSLEEPPRRPLTTGITSGLVEKGASSPARAPGKVEGEARTNSEYWPAVSTA